MIIRNVHMGEISAKKWKLWNEKQKKDILKLKSTSEF